MHSRAAMGTFSLHTQLRTSIFNLLKVAATGVHCSDQAQAPPNRPPCSCHPSSSSKTCFAGQEMTPRCSSFGGRGCSGLGSRAKQGKTAAMADASSSPTAGVPCPCICLQLRRQQKRLRDVPAWASALFNFLAPVEGVFDPLLFC